MFSFGAFSAAAVWSVVVGLCRVSGNTVECCRDSAGWDAAQWCLLALLADRGVRFGVLSCLVCGCPSGRSRPLVDGDVALSGHLHWVKGADDVAATEYTPFESKPEGCQHWSRGHPLELEADGWCHAKSARGISDPASSVGQALIVGMLMAWLVLSLCEDNLFAGSGGATQTVDEVSGHLEDVVRAFGYVCWVDQWDDFLEGVGQGNGLWGVDVALGVPV